MLIRAALAIFLGLPAMADKEKDELRAQLIQAQKEKAAAENRNDALIKEFKSLHAADAAINKRISEINQKRLDLEDQVNKLDLSVDTRVLVQAATDIKELQRFQFTSTEAAKEERERNAKRIETVLNYALGSLIAALSGGIAFVLKWLVFDPMRRKFQEDKQDDYQLQVMHKLGSVVASADSAYAIANTINDKIASIGLEMKDKRPVEAHHG